MRKTTQMVTKLQPNVLCHPRTYNLFSVVHELFLHV